jgi:hypothetical protein
MDDSELRSVLDHIKRELAKPEKGGSLREEVRRLERVVQGLAAEIAALQQQVHRVMAIGQPLPHPDSKDKP